MEINELYNRVLSGDKSAEEQLYQKLLVSFRVIVQHRVWDELSGEEIAQEALLTIFEKYKEIEIESNFSGWAYGVLQNKILDFVKMKQIRNRKMEEYISNKHEPNYQKPNPMLLSKLKKCFGKINDINKKHARILNFHFQGYTTEEICRILNITRSNLYASLSRARAQLETCLNQEDKEL